MNACEDDQRGDIDVGNFPSIVDGRASGSWVSMRPLRYANDSS